MREAIASRACCMEGVLKCHRHETLETVIDRIAKAEVTPVLVHFCCSGGRVTEPCWCSLAGASFGAGWQRRCGERDRLSVWPFASTRSHSCRYWRSVLTRHFPSSITLSCFRLHPALIFEPLKASCWYWWPVFLLLLHLWTFMGNGHNGVIVLLFSATHAWMKQDYLVPFLLVSSQGMSDSSSLHSSFTDFKYKTMSPNLLQNQLMAVKTSLNPSLNPSFVVSKSLWSVECDSFWHHLFTTSPKNPSFHQPPSLCHSGDSSSRLPGRGLSLLPARVSTNGQHGGQFVPLHLQHLGLTYTFTSSCRVASLW